MKFVRRLAHVVSMIAPLLLMASIASSQPPTPSRGNQGQQQQSQSGGQNQQPNADSDRANQQGVNVTVNNQNNATSDERDTAKRGGQGKERATKDWSTLAIAVATVVGAVATVVLVGITAGLVIVGLLQWNTYEATLRTNKDIERAYVTMSHHPPGVEIDDFTATSSGDVPRREIRLRIKIQNHGNTPARITHTVCHPVIADSLEALPAIPAYDERFAIRGRVSLVKGDSFDLENSWDWAESEVESTLVGPRFLCLIGYIDYIDKFNRHHRTGYGRWHDPAVDDERGRLYRLPNNGVDRERYARRNNLPYITNAGYNYDRERKKGEGNDWDE